ncbi:MULTISPECIES: phosphoribosyltransferase [unclassified Bradyrhizobium]|uniref:phosphoribosyltransferase n=2 Tax=unclassified Bradyrhizobium TaxID=2631580 RepID=UPI002915C6D1|nr:MULTISPECIES: phosphoribosyltransferase family protein [unclassified Bradyrhizobium]
MCAMGVGRILKAGDCAMSFENRTDAGRQLARRLLNYKDRNPVILALPRGGVPVAAEVAALLDAPLDLLIVRKIGVPTQPELAMGAVAEGAEATVVRNADVIELCQVSAAEFDSVCRDEQAEIERRSKRYLKGRHRAQIKGRLAIVIDDGIATGATIHAAIKAVRKQGPEEIVLAVPVAPLETLEKLRPEVDVIVCLDTPVELGAIGYFYRDFHQVSDEEVIALLEQYGSKEPVKRSANP